MCVSSFEGFSDVVLNSLWAFWFSSVLSAREAVSVSTVSEQGGGDLVG